MSGRADELRLELDGHRQQFGDLSFELLDAVFAKALPRLPLMHRLGKRIDDPAEVARAGRMTLQVAGAKAGRAAIGKDELLFCSVGCPAYVAPQVILALGPMETMRSGRASTPWDSRGAGVEREVVTRYTLAATEDEDYLAAHTATCFESLGSFIRGERPIRIDPARVFARQVYDDAPPQPELHTPEATFDAPVEVGPELLRGVFVDVDTLGRDHGRTLTALKRLASRAKVPYISNPGPGGLRDAASRFVLEQLVEAGIPC